MSDTSKALEMIDAALEEQNGICQRASGAVDTANWIMRGLIQRRDLIQRGDEGQATAIIEAEDFVQDVEFRPMNGDTD